MVERVLKVGGGNDCSTYEYYSFTAYDKEEDTTISKMTAIDEEKSTDIFEKQSTDELQKVLRELLDEGYM